MNEFFNRLMQLSKDKGFKSINKFAIDGLNYSSSEKLNRLKKENASPSVEILIDIANKFEDVNLNWLVLGKGEKYKSEITKLHLFQEPNDEYEVKNTLEAQRETIKILKSQLAFSNNLLASSYNKQEH